jgi:hypothetical protein
MWAPIAAVLMALGTFSTPEAIQSEQEWLAQHRDTQVEELQCAEVDVKAEESDRSGTC